MSHVYVDELGQEFSCELISVDEFGMAEIVIDGDLGVCDAYLVTDEEGNDIV